MKISKFLKVGNAKSLPYDNNSFDVVISINTIHNLDKEECGMALREISRVSKKNSFITVDAFRTEEEKKRMFEWNLTAKTILSVDEWKQFFKENNAFVELCKKHLNPKSVQQYQSEERSLIARRIKTSTYRVSQLLNCMIEDELSTPEKTYQLKNELADFYKNNNFKSCINMGDVLKCCLNIVSGGSILS